MNQINKIIITGIILCFIIIVLIYSIENNTDYVNIINEHIEFRYDCEDIKKMIDIDYYPIEFYYITIYNEHIYKEYYYKNC